MAYIPKSQLTKATPSAMMFFAGTQVFGHQTWTKITATPSSFVDSTGTMCDVTNSRIIIPEAGDYHIGASIRFADAGSDVQFTCRAFLNGTTEIVYSTGAQHGAGSLSMATTANSTIWSNLNANDYIELWGYWEQGGAAGNHTVNGGSQTTFIWVKKVGI